MVLLSIVLMIIATGQAFLVVPRSYKYVPAYRCNFPPHAQTKILMTNFDVSTPPLLTKMTSGFPFFVVGSAMLGVFKPNSLLWFSKYDSIVSLALSAIMVGMGMTLTMDDFKRILSSPQIILLGVGCQFFFMPLSAYFTGNVFQLSPQHFLGLALVGCCPGGTASNLVSLIANADVALSVLLTATSTVLASFLTPILTKVLCGSVDVEINGLALLLSTTKVVLLPIILGMVLNKKCPALSRRTSAFSPFMSVVMVSLICGSVVAESSGLILSGSSSLKPLLLAVGCLHSLGFALGYVVPRVVFGQDRKTSRTISIETGMQNSALAILLARSIGAGSAGCLPGAISATFHSCLGSVLAAFFRSRTRREEGI